MLITDRLSMYPRHIFMSRPHRNSRHGVRHPPLNCPDALFAQGFFVIKQHQWTPKSSTEMPSCHHHLHVRADDCVLDPLRRLHVATN
jgi:hypothetical protein